MKVAPSGIGAEPKKLVILGGLLLAAAGTYYWMSRPDAPAGASTPSPSPAVKVPVVATPAPRPATSSSAASSYGPRTSRGGRVSASADDFRPSLKPPEGVDLTRIDPTLKTELLSRVRQVSVEGGSRSLFEIYTPPPPPPPIPLKFYGYSGALRSTVRRAFFLDGEDIVQAGDNEIIRNRYKILRIGVNSAVVEDTLTKNQQTLPLAEEAQ